MRIDEYVKLRVAELHQFERSILADGMMFESLEKDEWDDALRSYLLSTPSIWDELEEDEPSDPYVEELT